MHFPSDIFRREKDDESVLDFFDGLCAEYKTGHYKRGHRVQVWEKKPGQPNEPLDLAKYNLAAAHYLGLHRYTPQRWATLRERLNPNNGDLFATVEDVTPKPAEETAASPIEHSVSSYKNNIAKQPIMQNRRIGLAAFSKRGAH